MPYLDDILLRLACARLVEFIDELRRRLHKREPH